MSIIPHGYYPTVKEYVSAVNKTLKTDANGDIWLTYNQLTRKMTAHVRNKARLVLTGRFASMVGFDKKEVMITNGSSENTEAPLRKLRYPLIWKLDFMPCICTQILLSLS